MTTNNISSHAPHKLTPAARKAIFASSIGTVIEWYDYLLYGVASGLVISPLFFPDAVEGVGILAALATFAVGFLVRPFGGLVIGTLGDKFGRRPALLLTIVLMGAATVGIGILPTAETIGIWAPILLVLLRALQGFGAGAELSGALTVASEYTPPHRRSFFTGIVNMTAGAGSAVATLAFLAVQALPQDSFMSWGWRIPFLLSAVLFLLALWIRRHLEETPEYQQAQRDEAEQLRNSAPIIEVFRSSPKRAILAIILWSGHNANTYIVLTFALSYLTSSNVGMDRTTALVLSLVGVVLGALATPLWGLLADRVGARKIYVGVMIFGTVAVVPYMLMFATGNPVLVLLAFLISSCVVWGATQATTGAVTTDLFPVEFRFSGVAVAKEINAAVVAGPTPFIAAALVGAVGGSPWLAALFIAAMFVITIISVVLLGKPVVHGVEQREIDPA